MSSTRLKWRRADSGNVAVEFAFIFPILVLMTMGALELSFVVFDYHKASEATRRGVRAAIINDPVADMALVSNGAITCSKTSNVSCTSGSVKSSSSFDAIVQAIQEISPNIADTNVSVTYADSGVVIGGSADIVTPVITVRINGVRYDFVALKLIPGFPSSVELPGFDTTRIGTSAQPAA